MKFIQSLDKATKIAASKQVTYENVRFHSGAQFVSLLDECARTNLISTEWSNNAGVWDDYRHRDGIIIETTVNPLLMGTTPQLIVQGGHQALLKFKSMMERFAEYDGSPQPEDIEIVHQYHDDLNPALWDKEGEKKFTLKEDVKDKLMAQAEAFFSYLKMDDMDIEDVVITGSSANYNWTENSDVDLHIVVDKSQAVQQYGKIVDEYFSAKKRLWNDLHDIRVKNVPVEFYVEGSTERATSAGVYSLMDDEWVSKPTHEEPTIDDAAVKAKAAQMIKEIQDVLSADKAAAIEKLVEKISKMRQSGLDEAGEFSTNNLVFKILRSDGWLQKMYDIKDNLFDRELSTEDEEWSHFV